MNVLPTTGPGPIVRLPLTFIVLLFILNVPPVTTTFVGASVLPALFVQEPFVLTSMSPPMVVLVPDTVTTAEVDTLLPPLVAVFPENVMLVPLVILCALVPLKLNVPVPAFKAVAGPAPPAFNTKFP